MISNELFMVKNPKLLKRDMETKDYSECHTFSSNTPYLYRKKNVPSTLLVNKSLPYKKPSVSFYHTTITMINLLYQLTNLSLWCENGQRKHRERFSSGCLLMKVHLLCVNLRHMWWNQVGSPATALKQETKFSVNFRTIYTL